MSQSLRKLMRILMIIAILSGAWSEETLIVNSSVAVSAIDEDTFKEIYLGKRTAWDDGSRVVVVVLKEGPSQEHLLQKLNKSSPQFLTGWKKLVFTGKGTMPEMVDSVDALVSMVAKTPGAIGYVEKEMIKDGVKAISLK